MSAGARIPITIHQSKIGIRKSKIHCVGLALSNKNKVCLAAALSVVLLISEGSLADADFQFWSTTAASFKVDKNWKATVEEHLKFGNDAGHFYLHHTDLGFVYGGLADWVDLGFNFKELFKEEDDGHWTRENRPHLNVTLKGRLGELDWTDGSRFEYRDREDQEDIWRYVNRLKVKLPYEFTKFKFRPYFADFVFINLDGQTFDKNRVYSGVSFELLKDVESELCCFWQSGKLDGRWEELIGVGLQVSIPF
jgi:hypothetical protein